jgi:hypothetical protein
LKKATKFCGIFALNRIRWLTDPASGRICPIAAWMRFRCVELRFITRSQGYMGSIPLGGMTPALAGRVAPQKRKKLAAQPA